VSFLKLSRVVGCFDCSTCIPLFVVKSFDITFEEMFSFIPAQASEALSTRHKARERSFQSFMISDDKLLDKLNNQQLLRMSMKLKMFKNDSTNFSNIPQNISLFLHPTSKQKPKQTCSQFPTRLLLPTK
jgi:hypothetical protein